jgi:hypothetical protein
MKPRISDATGWEPFEQGDKGVMIHYPVDVVDGIDTRAERRFGCVRKHVALSNWYKVTAPDCRDAYFYGERALSLARHHACVVALECRRSEVAA